MKKLKYWGAVLIFVLLLIRPEQAVTSAQNAMKIWYSSVAPALFPFLALMPLLTGNEACTAYEVLFSKCMRPLFGLPGAAAPAIVAGMLTGSPGGAMALKRISQNSKMSVSEVKRIALSMGGVSPAYLIMAVGLGLYNSLSLGFRLAGIQIAVQIMMLMILPRKSEEKQIKPMQETYEHRGNPIWEAVQSLLCICGYMVIFSVIAGVLSSFIGKKGGDAILLLIDLPSGLAALARSEMRMSVKMVLQGAAIGFTGLCIIAQNMDVLKHVGVSWKEYMHARITASGLFGVFSILVGGELSIEMQKKLMGVKETYAFSLLAITITMIPALFFLTKNLFLNIRNVRKNQTKYARNTNI